MFGLKIVKSKEYSALKNRVQELEELLGKNSALITYYDSEKKSLNAKIESLEERLAKYEEEPKTLLLTDVAEKPLVEEKKSRKTVKKTSEGSTRKRVLRKTDVL